jgi:Spy/CpxP family protein refolding chaperone
MQPRLVAAACVLITAIPTAVAVHDASDGNRRWWRLPSIQRQLRLTTRQVATLDSLFERGLPARIDQHRQIQDLDRRLARIMEDPTIHDDRVAELSAEVETLRARQNIRRTLMLFAMYQALTDEQRRMLTQMHRSTHDGARRQSKSR